MSQIKYTFTANPKSFKNLRFGGTLNLKSKTVLGVGRN
jgi:hypothetical protein